MQSLYGLQLCTSTTVILDIKSGHIHKANSACKLVHVDAYFLRFDF